MGRNTTLIELLDMYRHECGISSSSAHNIQDRDRQIHHIQRVQKWLWEDYDWPILRVTRDVELQAGQRYYDTPTDINIDRLISVQVYTNGAWRSLEPSIGAEHLSTYNSDLDERQWPPLRWAISEDEQVEVWPVPNTDGDSATLEGVLRYTGIRNLSPLISESDRADLDDTLITLFCAAEYLSDRDSKRAALKLDQANKRYRRLKSGQNPNRVHRFFGPSNTSRVERVPIAVYNSTS